MYARSFCITVVLCGIVLGLVPAGFAAEEAGTQAAEPAKVYVPYEKLRDVFEKKQQGVFLPREQFDKLWRAAQGRPKDVSEAPFEYLISTARFQGKVMDKDELAALRLELTIDILAEGWVHVPIGLGEVGVSGADFKEPAETKSKPLLRAFDGQYVLTAKGKGRYVVALDFVRQLKIQPGLHVLDYRMPAAAITTLELTIPEENLKVDVEPMLAATTSQVEADGVKTTQLKAFLGSANQVRLSWKPRTEAAPDLKPVIVCDQFQHINVGEALITHLVKLDYTIRRGGVDSFTVQLPARFRVTEVSGDNISKWDIAAANDKTADSSSQTLNVSLFSAAKNEYRLEIKMERFLQEAEAQIPLVPIVTDAVLRQTGLIGITCSPRRLVHLADVENLARVDTGRLPENLRAHPGTVAYRFIAADYSGTIAIGTASPRITVNQLWMLGVDTDALQLQASIHYRVERTGVFELKMHLPEPWKVESVGPDHLVDDHQLKTEGSTRILHILLKKEQVGDFGLRLVARADRTEPHGMVDFTLPLADEKDLQLYHGQLVLLLPDQLRAEVEEARQLQPISLQQANRWTEMPGLAAVMAFEFRAIDRAEPAACKFKIAVKPPQVSAVVHRLVNIQPGSIEQEAIIRYRIRYAPVDTFYLKMPEKLADAGVQISGPDIKEKPRISELPGDQRADDEGEEDQVKWAYYKIVLQSKVTGSYQCRIQARCSFHPGRVGQSTSVEVEPILAAGKLSSQNGHIAIAKADTLAIGEPLTENLTPADPGSAADLPHKPHRRIASLAFKYNAPPFELSFPVVLQKEATVFTTIVTGAIIEQVLARDGVLNTHATYLLQTAKGDRLPITLPSDAELTAVLLNGDEAPVETSDLEDQRIVRLSHSAGQVSRFVLEISYGLRNVSESNLAVPELPAEIPVQLTLWRLWIPRDHYLLAHDRVFSRIETHRCRDMLATLGRNQPAQVSFKLPSQGKVLDFVRQGGPGRLSVTVMGKETFSVVVWVLVIAAGLFMLRLSGFHRILVILAAGLVAGVLQLSLPLLISQVVKSGGFAAVLVLLLWVAQWAFVKLPEIRQALPPKKKRPGSKQGQEPSSTKGPKTKTAEERPGAGEQQDQSEKNEE